MKGNAKAESSHSREQIAAAVALLDLIAMATAKPKVVQPKSPKPPKTTGKPRGRRPMTDEQRAAAKAERDAEALAFVQPRGFEAGAKPQPVTRASLAAQQVRQEVSTHPGFVTYFTKAT